MSELIAITYPTEQRAREVMSTLRRMQLAHLVDLEDACYVTRGLTGLRVTEVLVARRNDHAGRRS